MKSKYSIFNISYIYLICLLLVRLIPILNPASRSWGFNHLIFLPEWYTYLFFAIGLIALTIPLFRFSESWGEVLANKFSEWFLDGKYKYFFRLLLIAIITTLFAVFAAPTHFLGDGYDVIKNIASPVNVHVKWSEIGSTKLMILLSYVLGGQNESASRSAFQLVSIISGALSIYFVFLISEIISDNNYKRYLVFITLTLSGTLLLYFGYAEFYPLAWSVIIGFICFGLRYLKTGKNLAVAITFLLVGLALHIQSIIFLPASIYLFLTQGRGLKLYRRYKMPLWLLLGAAFISFLAILIYNYSTNLYVEDIFLPLLNGKPIDPGYAIFSWSHLLDILNELLLISPLLLLYPLISGRNFRTIFKDKSAIFIGLCAAASLLFLFIIDPKLAMPRDWDLFSISAVVIALFVLILNETSLKALGRSMPTITIMLLISVLPFLLTNLSRGSSEKYIEYIINLDKEKSTSSLVVLTGYYQANQNKRKIDSLQTVYNTQYVQDIFISKALEAAVIGDMETASKLDRAIRPNRFNADYQRYVSIVQYTYKNYDLALEHINKAIQLRKFSPEYYWTRSRIYYEQKKYDLVLDDLRKAVSLKPTQINYVDIIAFVFDRLNRPDSCVYYAQRTLDLDSARFPSYKYIVKWLSRAGQFDRAREYRSLYESYSSADSAQSENLKQLDDLIANGGK